MEKPAQMVAFPSPKLISSLKNTSDAEGFNASTKRKNLNQACQGYLTNNTREIIKEKKNNIECNTQRLNPQGFSYIISDEGMQDYPPQKRMNDNPSSFQHKITLNASSPSNQRSVSTIKQNLDKLNANTLNLNPFFTKTKHNRGSLVTTLPSTEGSASTLPSSSPFQSPFKGSFFSQQQIIAKSKNAGNRNSTDLLNQGPLSEAKPSLDEDQSLAEHLNEDANKLTSPRSKLSPLRKLLTSESDKPVIMSIQKFKQIEKTYCYRSRSILIPNDKMIHTPTYKIELEVAARNSIRPTQRASSQKEVSFSKNVVCFHYSQIK